jgi:hypothetical protein
MSLHKSKIILVIALLFSIYGTKAQTSKLSIDNVYSVTLRNSGTIIENEEIKVTTSFISLIKLTERPTSTRYRF